MPEMLADTTPWHELTSMGHLRVFFQVASQNIQCLVDERDREVE
jgi:hypothetical protein